MRRKVVGLNTFNIYMNVINDKVTLFNLIPNKTKLTFHQSTLIISGEIS